MRVEGEGEGEGGSAGKQNGAEYHLPAAVHPFFSPFRASGGLDRGFLALFRRPEVVWPGGGREGKEETRREGGM